MSVSDWGIVLLAINWVISGAVWCALYMEIRERRAKHRKRVGVEIAINGAKLTTADMAALMEIIARAGELR